MEALHMTLEHRHLGR